MEEISGVFCNNRATNFPVLASLCSQKTPEIEIALFVLQRVCLTIYTVYSIAILAFDNVFRVFSAV